MTTVIGTRMPLETLKMSQQMDRRRRSKRHGGYDEEDGDFVFTRSKRQKTQASSTQAQQPPDPAPVSTTAKKAKKAQAAPREDDQQLIVKKTRTRKSEVPAHTDESESKQQPKRRRSARLSDQGVQNGIKADASEVNSTTLDMVDVIGDQSAEEPQPSTIEIGQSTLIALPFSDTPIIDRNKELRKKGGGQRRSSLGMRGRRASSLIDNGHSAIPHREVDTQDFYKHIEADGPSEPRRMKQLLTWCAERALGEKPSHGKDSAAELAARVITEQLLKDFSNKSEFSDWFSREEIAPPKRVVKQPNPKNVDAEQAVVNSEAKIKDLKAERDRWKALSKPPPALTPILPAKITIITPSAINSSLLDPEQAAILATISNASATSLRANAQERLRKIHSSLEFKVDQFTDGVHKIEQYQETVGRVADRILRTCAGRLEERDKIEKEAVGTRDVPMQEVLRSLSRILPEGGAGR